MTHLTDFSRLPARYASRGSLADHKWNITTSGGREKPAFGGPNPSIWCVAALARCTTSRCAPRLPEWPDLTPSKGSIISSFGITGSFGCFVALLLPFLYIFNTEMLLIDVGPLKAIFLAIVAIAAMMLFAAATQGFWLVKSKIWETVALLLIGLVLWVQRRRRVVPAAKAA